MYYYHWIYFFTALTFYIFSNRSRRHSTWIATFLRILRVWPRETSHRRRFELKIFADDNSLAHALTYLQDPLRWWTYNATCDCRPANRGRLCLWRPANYLKLAPFKPPRPLSIRLYLPARSLCLARSNPHSPPSLCARASRSSPNFASPLLATRVSFAPTSLGDFPSRSAKTPSSFVVRIRHISCRTFLIHVLYSSLIFHRFSRRTRNLLFSSPFTLPNLL